MREIKFRIWYKGKMTYPVDTQSYNEAMITLHGGIFFFNEPGFYNGGDHSAILEQYTGLKDKNGKEIYEGDIVLWHGSLTFYVLFEYGAFVANEIGQEEASIPRYRWNELEIIGNIHQILWPSQKWAERVR